MTKHSKLPAAKELRRFFYVDDAGLLRWSEKPHPKANVEAGMAAGFLNEAGYRKVKFRGNRYYAHRIAWKMFHNLEPGDFQIDHINRNKDDNSRENLRLATNRENSFNRISNRVRKGSEECIYDSGSKLSPYRVIVCGKFLGNFASLEQARSSRDAYRCFMFGDFSPS